MNHATNTQSTLLNRVLAKRIYAITLVLSCFVMLAIGPQRSAADVATAKKFPTPQAAAEALIDAAEKYDVPALEAILGPGADEIIQTGEPARDAEVAKQFAEQARTKMKVTLDPKSKTRAFITIGNEDWPFPAPIVKSGATWSFDSKAGVKEILARRIGRNELDAIQISRGFVEAQNEYALTKHGDSKVNQYAQTIISTPGKQDGLAWQNPDGTWGGPIGEKAAAAIERGYSRGQPYHGYYFKVLKGQGPDAPLGQMDYVVNGAMIGGFALIAFPSDYGRTGIMTFMVSNDGVVYQKDLGPNTAAAVKKIDRFNPDKGWSPVTEDESKAGS
jgi:hypothetical protein